MEIGTQIKNRRKELNMTQEELSLKLNVSRSAVSNWESGRNYPDMQTMIRISETLNVSLDYLLKGDTETISQLSEDTRVRARQINRRKRFPLLLIALACIGMFLFYRNIKYEDISDPDQVVSVVKNKYNELSIRTDLPKYRTLICYYIDNSSNDDTIIQLSLGSSLDFSLKNNNAMTAAIPEYISDDVSQINIVYHGDIIKTFYLDE